MNDKTKEEKVLNNIKELLGAQTKNMSKQEKAKFLSTLGYSSFKEIEALEYDQMFDFYEHIKNRKGLTYSVREDVFKGYLISRPENPKSVRDISFKIKGHEIR